MVKICNSHLFRSIFCLLLAFLILAYAVILPVRASVLGFVGFATRSLIASLIRACGVYVADGIQDTLAEGLSAWESLVDYIAAKVPAEYLYVSAAGERFVKTILKDGLYYADRNLVEWVIETLTEVGENSSGEFVQPVGYGFPDMEQWQVNQINAILDNLISKGRYYASYTRDTPYCCFIDFSPSSSASAYKSPFVIFTEEEYTDAWFNPNSGTLFINVPAGAGVMLWQDDSGGSGSLRTSSSESYFIEIKANGATILNYEADITVQTHGGFGGSFDSIRVESDTPSISDSWAASAVTVTDSSTGSTVVGVPVSVPSDDTEDTAVVPWGDVTSGTESGGSSVAIPGTGTNTGTGSGSEAVPDSDATSQSGFWQSVLSWLNTLWNTLTEILSGVLAIPIAIAQAISVAIADVIAAIKSLVPEPPSFGDFQIPGLKDFFPFCIPFDLLAMMRALSTSPVAPSFTFACPLPGGGVYNVNIDLSAWNGVASTIRSVVVAIYVVTLANSTRKFIRW